MTHTVEVRRMSETGICPHCGSGNVLRDRDSDYCLRCGEREYPGTPRPVANQTFGREEMRLRMGNSLERAEQAMAMLEEGQTINQVARALGVTNSAIYAYRRVMR